MSAFETNLEDGAHQPPPDVSFEFPVALGGVLRAALRHARQADGRPLLLAGPAGVGKSTCASAMGKCLGLSVAFFDVAVPGLRLGQRDGLRELPLVPRRTVSDSPSSGAKLIVVEHADRLPGGLAGSLMGALVDIATQRDARALEHYFGVASNAGDTLFVLTTQVPVSAALDASRFVIELVGYSLAEKAAIAARMFQDAGRQLPAVLVEQLVRIYAKGPGVDSIAGLVSKASKLADDDVTLSRIVTLAGEPPTCALDRYISPLPGQVITMGWGPEGGILFVVEVGFGRRADGDLRVLGKGGEAMEGAAKIALNVVNSSLEPSRRLGAATGRPVLMNFPNSWKSVGAAAGLAMSLAMYGLATGQRVLPALAVTGELTLGGLVLPVPSCSARLLASESEHVDRVIVPEGNRAALREVVTRLRKGLEVTYVSTFAQAIALSF